MPLSLCLLKQKSGSRQKSSSNNYFLLFRANVKDSKYFWPTFTNYNMLKRMFSKKCKMLLNLSNYSQRRSYFCLPTLENSPHVQHFLAAIHTHTKKKIQGKRKRERERDHQKQPILKLSHCFSCLIFSKHHYNLHSQRN